MTGLVVEPLEAETLVYVWTNTELQVWEVLPAGGRYLRTVLSLDAEPAR